MNIISVINIVSIIPKLCLENGASTYGLNNEMTGRHKMNEAGSLYVCDNIPISLDLMACFFELFYRRDIGLILIALLSNKLKIK
jgi:hypothetical protein